MGLSTGWIVAPMARSSASSGAGITPPPAITAVDGHGIGVRAGAAASLLPCGPASSGSSPSGPSPQHRRRDHCRRDRRRSSGHRRRRDDCRRASSSPGSLVMTWMTRCSARGSLPGGGAVSSAAPAGQSVAVDRDDAESFGAAFAVGARIIRAYRAGQRVGAAVHQLGVGDLDPPVDRPGAGLIVGFAEPHIQSLGRGSGSGAPHRDRIR